MTQSERLIKLGAATPAMWAKIDAILEGRDTTPSKMPKADPDTRTITFTEAAKRLNLSRPTVYRLVKKHRLDTVPLDGVNRIVLQSVFDFAAGLRSA